MITHIEQHESAGDSIGALALASSSEPAATGPDRRRARTRIDFSRFSRSPRPAGPPPSPDWLIPGWYVRGTLNIIAGAPEAGKSTWLMRIAANLSQGLDFMGLPLPKGLQEETVWLSSEEGVAVAHKATLAGAPPMGVTPIPTELGDSLLGKLGSGDYSDQLFDWAVRNGATVVVLDHLIDWLGIKNGNDEGDVRPALRTLASAATRHGVTVFGILHTGKGVKTSAVNALNGSIAFQAVCRSLTMVYFLERAGLDNGRYATLAKANIGGKKPTVVFELAGEEDGFPVATYVEDSPLGCDDLQALKQADLVPTAQTRTDARAFAFDALFPDAVPRPIAELLPIWQGFSLSESQLRRQLNRWEALGRLTRTQGGERVGKLYSRATAQASGVAAA